MDPMYIEAHYIFIHILTEQKQKASHMIPMYF